MLRLYMLGHFPLLLVSPPVFGAQSTSGATFPTKHELVISTLGKSILVGRPKGYRNMPMPGLVNVRLDPCFAAGSIPGILAVRFCAERRSLSAQKQGDALEVDRFALCQSEILVEGVVRRIK